MIWDRRILRLGQIALSRFYQVDHIEVAMAFENENEMSKTHSTLLLFC